MKVGTDAMVLGALCRFDQPKHVLDIGTGTGVLSLMVAQRFQPETITAVELESAAAGDARFNFKQSPFSTQFELLEQDVRELPDDRLFDGIITNPPFFVHSSKSDSAERNRARHTDDLPFSDLMDCCARLLSDSGLLWMIVPTEARIPLEALGKARELFLRECIVIHGKPDTPVRVVLAFGKAPAEPKHAQLTIRTAAGHYTDAYFDLTREFHNVDLTQRSQ